MTSNPSSAQKALASAELFNEVSIDISSGPLLIGSAGSSTLSLDEISQVIDGRFGMGATDSLFLSSNNSGKCLIYHLGIRGQQPGGYSIAGYFVFFPEAFQESRADEAQDVQDA
jgi:hypothetical protein